MSVTKNRANGLRVGAHVHIIRPAHNSRRLGVEDNDYSKSGVVTREGSSANGGWFEILLDGTTNKYVYYRRGSLEVIHHGPDGQPLAPVPLDELPPPGEPKPRRGTSGQKRKQRASSDEDEEYIDDPTPINYGIFPPVHVRDRVVRAPVAEYPVRKQSILEAHPSLFNDYSPEASDSEDYSDDETLEEPQKVDASAFAMLGRVTVPLRQQYQAELVATPASLPDDDAVSENGTDATGLLSPSMGATRSPILNMPSPAKVNLLSLTVPSPGFNPIRRNSLTTPSPLPAGLSSPNLGMMSPFSLSIPLPLPSPLSASPFSVNMATPTTPSTPSTGRQRRKSSIPSRSVSSVEPSFASSQRLWAL